MSRRKDSAKLQAAQLSPAAIHRGRIPGDKTSGEKARRAATPYSPQSARGIAGQRRKATAQLQKETAQPSPTENNKADDS